MPEENQQSCSRCLELERQLAALKAQVDELTKQLEAKSRAGKRQAAPFRRGTKAGEKKKPGQKPGHTRQSRPDPTPEQIDRTLEAPVEVCPQCQSALEDVATHVQFQTDLPPVQPTVTQFNVQVGYCPCCKLRVQGTHPEQTSQALGAAHHALGPRAIATAVDMKYRLGIPFRKIADFFQGSFGVVCAPSALCRAAERLAERSQGLLSILKLQLAGRDVVHVDETGWWIGGSSAYLHVFGVEDLVIFQVGDRSRQLALDLLGPRFEGLVVCDGYAGYDLFETVRCNAHPLRRIRDLLAGGLGEPSVLREIQQLLLGGLSLRDRRESLTAQGYQRLVTRHKHNVRLWIEANCHAEDLAIGRLARHLGKYEQEFLRYLDDPAIPATNNFAEGLLRFAVVLRKVGCCNRTALGVRAFETLSSLLATFRRRGLSFVDWVIQFLQGGGPKYVPPDLLPSDLDTPILLTGSS